MRTTTFTFRYWDRDNTTHHSLDVIVLTPLTSPPFTSHLDIHRILSSPHTVFPSSSTSLTDLFITHIFETFATIPPRLDSTSTPIHFTFRGVHTDTLIESEAIRIGDHYQLRYILNDNHQRIIFLDYISPINTSTFILTEPPPSSIYNHDLFCNIGPCTHFLSVPCVMPSKPMLHINPKCCDGFATWDISHVTSLKGLLNGCWNMIDISAFASWDTSHVTNLDITFMQCSSLVDITALASWNTSKVTNMKRIFAYCHELTDLSPLAEWDMSKVTNMNMMFEGCIRLRDVSAIANRTFTSVKMIDKMFIHCDPKCNANDVVSHLQQQRRQPAQCRR